MTGMKTRHFLEFFKCLTFNLSYDEDNQCFQEAE